ncbi:MAG: transcriptional regulator [Caulobacter sp.]|nr:transcriptional regulator [Caulobacter sp.]
MADGSPAPITHGGALEVADAVYNIPLALIEVVDRQRPIDPTWAGALGQIMASEGGTNRTPIEVCRLPGRNTYRLVAGGHRLEGGRLQGWETIRGVIVSADALDRRLAEISENLWRNDLAPIDRASAVAQMHELLKTRSGLDAAQPMQAVAAQVRWQKALQDQAEDASLTLRIAYGFTEDLAAALGLSRPTIYRDLELHRRLLPDVAALVRGHPVSRNAGQLLALSKLPEADQRAAAQLLVEGKIKTVAEASATLTQKAAPTAEAKRLSAFIGAFARMGKAERNAALKTLQAHLPAGVKLSFADGAA